MVISVKKESEKTLSLSKITKEILEYCDTEAALENLRDEWSKFKDFKELLQIVKYYSPNYYDINKSSKTFSLNEELSFLDKMRSVLSSDDVLKWDDLNEKDKKVYNFLLAEVRENFDVITNELSNKKLSYDIFQKKFVISYEKKNDYNDQRINYIYSKCCGVEAINTGLLVLFDLNRISTMQASYKTKLEFTWFKYLLDLVNIDEFFKEVLQQLKREAKSKLKNFTTTLEYDWSYPSGLFGKKLIEKYIKESFITDGTLYYDSVTDQNIFNYILQNNQDDHFNTVLKENLCVSRLSDQQLVYLVICQPELYIDGYSNLNDSEKDSMIRDILLRWSNNENFTSRSFGVDFIKKYFTDEEIFVAFKSRTKEILQAILSKSTHPYSCENNLIKLENGNYIDIKNSSEPTSSDFSESQLSELKTEFIPILEKIQDVILVNLEWYNNKYLLESIIKPNSTKKEKIKRSLASLSYGEFLMWIFYLLDWVPTQVLLTKKIGHLELENKYNPEVIKVQNLYDFREDVVSMLLFKDMLEFAGADYVSCCVVETLYADNDDYTIDSDDKFRKLLKVSLGKNVEFLEYAGKNLNKDIYEQSKKSNLIHISAPKFKI